MSTLGCKNKPDVRDLPGYFAQDGWLPDGRRNMVWIRTDWIDQACGYDKRKADSRCKGCKWRFA